MMEVGGSRGDFPMDPLQHTTPLVVDDDPMVDDDEDFAGTQYAMERVPTIFRYPIEDDETINSTRSLHENDIEYIMIDGRRYCGNYYMPNDQEEQDRSQLLHVLFKEGLSLTSVPLHNPRKILDIGTGTGEWVMDIAENYPDAEVIGTDLAPIQARQIPPNAFFQIDDAEEEGGWTWPEDDFDLIHLRSMAGAFTSWQYIYKEAFLHLKPGGWLEVLDFDNHSKLMSYFKEDPNILEWLNTINKAAQLSGRPRGDAHIDPKLLKELGFVDVTVSEKTMPTGSWPEDATEQEQGRTFLSAMMRGIQAVTLRPLTEHLGWTIEEVRPIVRFVQQRLKSVAMNKEKAQGMGFVVKILVGKKPLTAQASPPAVDVPDGESIKTMTNGE